MQKCFLLIMCKICVFFFYEMARSESKKYALKRSSVHRWYIVVLSFSYKFLFTCNMKTIIHKDSAWGRFRFTTKASHFASVYKLKIMQSAGMLLQCGWGGGGGSIKNTHTHSRYGRVNFLSQWNKCLICIQNWPMSVGFMYF